MRGPKKLKSSDQEHSLTVFSLSLQDFPFLRHHKTRKGVITMENNEMVAVCLDCFDTLRSQFNESERYGIPLEKRQYNWMQGRPRAATAHAPPAAAAATTVTTAAD